jgi:hypothetical protein
MNEHLNKLIAAGIPRDRALTFLMGADMTSRVIGQGSDTVMRWATNQLFKTREQLQKLAEDGLQSPKYRPEDVEATVKHVILDVIASTYGQPPEKTRDMIAERIKAPDTLWAFQLWIEERDQ